MKEHEKRRHPGWKGGTAVTMADGQAWTLARPVARLRPDGDGFRVALAMPGTRFQELIERQERSYAFMDSIERLDSEARHSEMEAHENLHPAAIELGLVRELLLVNYDLTDDELGQILQFGYDEENDPEGVRIRRDCMDVVQGVAPKPPADTSGSA